MRLIYLARPYFESWDRIRTRGRLLGSISHLSGGEGYRHSMATREKEGDPELPCARNAHRGRAVRRVDSQGAGHRQTSQSIARRANWGNDGARRPRNAALRARGYL